MKQQRSRLTSAVSRARASFMLAEIFFLRDLSRRLEGELEAIESRIRNLESGIRAEESPKKAAE